MDRQELALSRFDNGFNCAQATFSVLAEELGLPLPEALRIASPFGGGVVSTGSLCGILTGGLMAIGLQIGKDDPANDEATARTKELGRRYMEWFEDEFGSLTCSGLMGCDMGTPEGQEHRSATGLKEKTCKPALSHAVATLAALLSLPKN